MLVSLTCKLYACTTPHKYPDILIAFQKQYLSLTRVQVND